MRFSVEFLCSINVKAKAFFSATATDNSNTPVQSQPAEDSRAEKLSSTAPRPRRTTEKIELSTEAEVAEIMNSEMKR